MTKDEIIQALVDSNELDRQDFNADSENDSTYGCLIAEKGIYIGTGMDCSTAELVQSIDRLTTTELWEINLKLVELGVPLSLADSPGVKPEGKRKPRPS